MADAQSLLHQCAAIDLEVTPDGTIFHVGAVYGGDALSRKVGADPSKALHELDAFVSGARYVVGHNILDHDLPIVRGLFPACRFLNLPVIDTLILSPLAFPRNPYHRLIKDYKLVRDAVNDPVADARLAMRVLADEWDALSSVQAMGTQDLRSVLRCSLDGPLNDRGGHAAFFQHTGTQPLCLDRVEHDLIARFSQRACVAGLRRFAESFRTRPPRIEAAYAMAWLTVAGGNSVLPRWVRHRFPLVGRYVRGLRGQPCGDDQCSYCRSAWDAKGLLKRIFGFDDFRPEPKDPSGVSLQRTIIEAGLGDQPLLAILPTGGGKSLCYQLPALARYERRASLTVVISPLQALMKDQVDNFREKTGSPAAAALYGMLTPPERGAVMEQVRRGDIGILYVSPEQLRNSSFARTVDQREIGCWVFDEAHCLSKWGHDFRPDYLYASRFIREAAQASKTEVPPIVCYTATAKRDVVEEICSHFDEQLGQTLTVFEGGVERHNLEFQVHPVEGSEKFSRTHELLTEYLSEGGTAIIYASTRARVELIARFLVERGWNAEGFHAGLDAPLKRDIQERFVRGELQVISATNAFGMGIDKDNVRLVIHADVPGSLENYLQEAGRAGRDGAQSTCVLLHSNEETERQFQMTSFGQLSRRDVAQILRGVRRAVHGRGSVIITPGELIRDPAVSVEFDSKGDTADTKVKTALAWLERARFLSRHENRTSVWQGQLLLTTMEQIRQRIAQLNLSERRRRHWTAVAIALIQRDPNHGLSTDQLAELPELGDVEEGESEGGVGLYVHRILQEMSQAGIVKETLMLSAYVRHHVERSSRDRLDEAVHLELDMLRLMTESAPDADEDGAQVLSLRDLNHKLKQDHPTSDIDALRVFISSLGSDGLGFGERAGSMEAKHLQMDHYRVKVRQPWARVIELAQWRHELAGIVLTAILAKLGPQDRGASLLVEFSADDLYEAVHGDMYQRSRIKDVVDAVRRALMYLHDMKVIVLQHGLAVFRQAMTIELLPESKGRRYGLADFEPLRQHYSEQVLQIHVMAEYAQRGINSMVDALRLVLAYFSMDRTEFVKRYFAGREQEVGRPVSQEVFKAIVDDLHNPLQSGIVSAPTDRNLLVLAGPGSGKTRVVVHRVAYLVQVKRVPPRAVLVICFNRMAAAELRYRLRGLIGSQAAWVTVLTYHALAMRLLGLSPSLLAERAGDEGIDFDGMIRSATSMLRGESALAGIEPDEVRDRLLAGYRHILVDEYQDIDSDQYDLISALTDRTGNDPDSKLTIMAVGDDDQNIYSFRGANVQFIRRFEADYKATCHYLTDNYRSTSHIIASSDQLIARNRDRMKTEHEIQINPQRSRLPPGGRLTELDPLARGRVQVLRFPRSSSEALVAVAELVRIQSITRDEWDRFALLAPTRAEIQPIRAVCEHLGIPVRWTAAADGMPRLEHIREVAAILERLNSARDQILPWGQIACMLQGASDMPVGNPWHDMVTAFCAEWQGGDTQSERLVADLINHLYETLTAQRRELSHGKGLFLGTVHAAKGLEFDHVVVPGSNWTPDRHHSEEEARRRTCYVAMTRARQSLTLLEPDWIDEPMTAQLSGPAILRRQAQALDGIPPGILNRRYELLGMRDFDLGYLSTLQEDHPSHGALRKAWPGTSLQLRGQGRPTLTDAAGVPLARLSSGSAERWADRLDRIVEIRLHAVARRSRDSTSETYRSRCRVDRWEVPIALCVWQAPQ